MRSSLIVLGFLVGVGTPAMAQSALDGPLAAPGDAPAVPTQHPARAKAKRTRHAAGKAAAAKAPDTPTQGAAASPAEHNGAPDDPVSLGMKWNGSNDTAAQTRFQNLNGNAAGTGAEVGLKLHF